MADRVRNRRGQFVTPEEKAREDEQYSQMYGWNGLEVIKEFPDGNKLVRVTEAEDLTKWGKMMGHCGGSHYKWTTIERIWHFLTVIDTNGKPHCTWHLKDKAWVGTPHPDDAPEGKYSGNGASTYVGPHEMGLKFGRSTTYDLGGRGVYSYVTRTYRPYDAAILDGKEVVVLSKPYDAPKWSAYFDQWWQEAKVADQANAVA
jgi:hypothetical protein